MISKTLQFTTLILDQFLKNRFGLAESKVVLNKLIEGNGTVPAINSNKVVISLINIEKETAKPFYNRNQQLPAQSSTINPAERYDLEVLISSNFDDYAEGLKFLDAVIVFFEINYTFNSNSSSQIPSGLEKLEFELIKNTSQELYQVWSSIGASYQPSVSYKLRLIPHQETMN